MQRRDYYLILGVPRDETAQGIRGAFRDLIQRHEPGRAGQGALPSFDSILEAYHVLSDNERRASYDRGLEDGEPEPAPPPPPSSSEARRRPPVEPLIPEPLSLARDFEVGRPSYEQVLHRIRSNFVPHERGPQGIDALRLEISVGPDEAEAGGELLLAVPVFVTCPRCRGAGRALAAYRCAACGGTGRIEQERPARLMIPPGVRDGSVFQLPLTGLGIRNLYLEVRVRVRG